MEENPRCARGAGLRWRPAALTSTAAAAAPPAEQLTESRLFTGHAIGSRPPTAEIRAWNNAVFFANGAGFGHCELYDESLEPEPEQGYEAFVTLICYR